MFADFNQYFNVLSRLIVIDDVFKRLYMYILRIALLRDNIDRIGAEYLFEDLRGIQKICQNVINIFNDLSFLQL